MFQILLCTVKYQFKNRAEFPLDLFAPPPIGK